MKESMDLQSEELLDLVNQDDEVIGTVLRKEVKDNPNLAYRTIAVIVLNHKNQILIVKRSIKVSNQSGRYICAVNGHVKAGEQTIDTARRELKEELGIKVSNMNYFGKKKLSNETITKFNYVYYCYYEGDDFSIDGNEITEAKWLDWHELYTFSNRDDYHKGTSHQGAVELLQYLRDEELDLVTKEDEIIGTVKRSAAHKNPALIHRGTGLIVFNKNGQTLLTRRSQYKPDPGKWVIASSGHIPAGEDPLEAIRREAKEELEIDVDPIFYKKVFWEYENETMIYYISYIVLDNDQISKVVVDPKETDEVAWVDVDKLEEFAKEHNYDASSQASQLTVTIAKEINFI